jgi:hypothetical protein
VALAVDGYAQLRVTLSDGERALSVGERLTRALVTAGVDVASLSPETASLEQVFAELTRDDPDLSYRRGTVNGPRFFHKEDRENGRREFWCLEPCVVPGHLRSRRPMRAARTTPILASLRFGLPISV